MANNRLQTKKTTSSNGDLSKDVTLRDSPADSISALAFSSAIDWLAVASWDSTVKCYDLTQGLAGHGRAQIEFSAPVLTCHWSLDGQKVVGAGIDKTARMLDLGANGSAAVQVAQHDEPIRSARFFQVPASGSPMLATGSWDKSICYWDLRQSTPAAKIMCSDRVYSMDIKEQLLAVATADDKYSLVDLANPTVFFMTKHSPLKKQSRVISCYNNGRGFAIGGVEGRCAFQDADNRQSASNFTFKCHRETPSSSEPVKVFAVNDISVHPIHGTFSTAGSDGTFNYWDRDSHSRLQAFPKVEGTIPATAFNRNGSLFAYAVSYDWSMGYAYYTPQYPNKVIIHPVDDAECRPRASQR